MSGNSEKYGIIYNPISGRGLAKNYADKIVDCFQSKGENIQIRESSLIGSDQDFLSSISGLIVVGGDGTIRPYLPRAARFKIPIILFPAGNESLIAKQFQVNNNIQELFDRVKRNKPTFHHYGLANEEPFFLMCSVGFDAEVVHWVKKHRRDYSSDILYFYGILASIFKVPDTYMLTCDKHSSSFKGSFIIANSPFYGGNIKPVPDADSSKGKLRVRYFVGSYIKLLLKFVLMRLGIDNSGRGDEVEVIELKSISERAIRFQIDGEAKVAMECLRVRVSEERVKFY